MNSLIDFLTQTLSSEEISAEECEILVSNLSQIKPYQECLDTLISKLYTHKLNEAEEKEIQKSDNLPIQIARVTGRVHNIQLALAAKDEKIASDGEQNPKWHS